MFGVLLPDFDDMIHAAAKLGAIKRLNEGFSNCGYPRETVANVTQRGVRSVLWKAIGPRRTISGHSIRDSGKRYWPGAPMLPIVAAHASQRGIFPCGRRRKRQRLGAAVCKAVALHR